MAPKIHRLDPDEMAKDLKFPERTGGGRGGGDIWFNWPKKDYEQWHRFRFIDAVGKAKLPWVGHCCHYRQIGRKRSGWPGLDGSGRTRAITCTEYHLEQPCPVCELIAYCERQGDEPKGLGPQVQWLTNIITEDNEVKVWGRTPVSVIRKLKELHDNPRFGPKLFDAVNGRDMEIIRHGYEGADFNEISYETVHCDPSEIEVEDWESQVKDLTSFIKYYDRDLIIRVLEAQLGDIYPVAQCFRGQARSKARPSKKKVAKRKVAKKTARKKTGGKRKR